MEGNLDTTKRIGLAAKGRLVGRTAQRLAELSSAAQFVWFLFNAVVCSLRLAVIMHTGCVRWANWL